MRPICETTYHILLGLLKGTFKKPVKDRSQLEKNAVLLFWRRRNKLTFKRINREDILYYDNKRVVTKESLISKVKRTKRAMIGGGARAISHKLKGKFEGVSERSVKKVLERSKSHGQLHGKFNNSPPLRSVRATYVFERVQIDLLKLNAVANEGRIYKYVLTAVDVFSRYIFSRALENKSSAHVAKALHHIFSEHGWPKIVQCDNGPEFMGDVKDMLNRKKVKIIKGRPYHPESQGKVESQNRIIRQKIRHQIHRRGQQGFSWVAELSKITNAINRHPKEVLAYQTPFVVYFARDNGQISVQEIREKALAASDRCAKRMQERHLKKKACSIYEKGARVLIRYPFGKRVPYKRHVLKGKILKRGKTYDRYKVVFRTPEGSIANQWVGVENITSRTTIEEKERRSKASLTFAKLEKKRKHVQKYYIVKERTVEGTHMQKDQNDEEKGTVMSDEDRLEKDSAISDEDRLEQDSAISDEDRLEQVSVISDEDRLEQDSVISDEDRLEQDSVISDEEDRLEQGSAISDGDSVEQDSMTHKKERQFANYKGIYIVEDPQDVGSCQFLAVSDQIKKIGIYLTGSQLRKISISHIEKHRDYYQPFVSGSFNSYLKSMAMDKTFGDNLTLLALSREFNCQFVVISSRGQRYHRIISNTGKYDSDLHTFTLGFYPEIHYVSVCIRDRRMMNDIISSCISEEIIETNENENVNQEEKTDSGDGENCIIGGSNQSNVNNVYLDSAETHCVSNDEIGDNNASPADQNSEELFIAYGPIRSGTCSVPPLPYLAIRRIVYFTIRASPIMRYTLHHVSPQFAEAVASFGYPQIYIRPSEAVDLPQPVSVARIGRIYGSHSGLMLRVRHLLRESGGRWYRAWLWLREVESRWFEVRDITWNRQCSY